MAILLGIFSLYLFVFVKLPVLYREEIHIPLLTAVKISSHHQSYDNIPIQWKAIAQSYGERANVI